MPDRPSTPLDRERALVDLVWSASSERAESERTAAARGARGKSLNERMHRSALDSLEESCAEQLREVATGFTRRINDIEVAAEAAVTKVRADEKTLRAQAVRQAEDKEDETRGAYDERVWMAESVFEAAIPEIRKAHAARMTELGGWNGRLTEITEAAHQTVRGYRQRALAEPTVPMGGPGNIDACMNALAGSLTQLRACRISGVFRGPILVIPLVLMVGAGFVGGLVLKTQLGLEAIPAGAAGAGVALTLFVIAIAVLYGLARHEVKARYLPFLQTAATARAALNAAIEGAERNRREREDVSKRARDADLATADAMHKPMVAEVERKLKEVLAHIDQKVPHYHAKALKQRAIAIEETERLRDRLITEVNERRTVALAEEQHRWEAVAREAAELEFAETAAAHAAWRTAQQTITSGFDELQLADRECTRPWLETGWDSWQPPLRPLAVIRVGEVGLNLKDVPGALPVGAELAWTGVDTTSPWRVPAFLGAPERMSLLIDAPPVRRADGLRI